MGKPKLLDLFCGAGGASMGYYRAGFEVEGVDINPQPHYPFKFYLADALEFPLEGYDAYHASPPCQGYSRAGVCIYYCDKEKYPKLIEDVKSLFKDKLWIIENVPGAPIPVSPTLEGDYGLMLCGTMFGLRKVRRHRLFLSSIPIPRPIKDCSHREYAMNPYDKEARERDNIKSHAFKHYGIAMGIDWMDEDSIGEAIPPAYTEYIGKYLLSAVRGREVDNGSE